MAAIGINAASLVVTRKEWKRSGRHHRSRLIETSVTGKRFGCAYLFSIVREGYNMKLAVIALVITVALSHTSARAQPGDQCPPLISTEIAALKPPKASTFSRQ